MPVSNPSASSSLSSYWALAHEEVVSSAVQTFDKTGLAGDTDGAYIIEGKIVNDQGSDSACDVRINSASWAGNRQFFHANNTTVTAGRDTTTNVVYAPANSTTTFKISIPACVTGDTRQAIIETTFDDGAAIRRYDYSFEFTTPATGTEITALGLGSNIASGIGVGSVIRIWKRVT